MLLIPYLPPSLPSCHHMYLSHDLLLLLLVRSAVIHLLRHQRLPICLPSDLSNHPKAAPSQGLQDVKLLHTQLTSQVKPGRAGKRERGAARATGGLATTALGASTTFVQLLSMALTAAVYVDVALLCLVASFLGCFLVRLPFVENLKIIGRPQPTPDNREATTTPLHARQTADQEAVRVRPG